MLVLWMGILFPADAAPLTLIEEYKAKDGNNTERDDKIPNHRQVHNGPENIEYHDFLI